ncbi:MAG: ABC transporter substrate-binding protein [Verrucomicrobia bacterium]|nr:ABC transporter substrate-binding protein [Verrucomicrobiota bacterium]MCH8526993.1 ABC transporter substrate-binding protein [Kiritimatiellia bacterium]
MKRKRILSRTISKRMRGDAGSLIPGSLILLAGGCLCFAGSVSADAGPMIPRDAWPASWFEHPKTASEMGITEFSQAPEWEQREREGTLPPLSERLPADPPVIEPYAETGRYGGSVRTAGWLEYYFNPLEFPLRMCPEGATTRYSLVKEVEASDNLTTYTLRLREGIRWSDGHPHTADDYLFWFEHVYMNRELTPVRYSPFYDNTRMRAPDPHTLEIVFEEPNAYFMQQLAHPSPQFRMPLPAHYAKTYHPDFADGEEIKRRTRDLGLMSWTSLFDAAVIRGVHGNRVFDLPVLRAYRLERVHGRNFYYRRNPYYWKIDPAGQQLPYIREIARTDGITREMAVAQAASGALTLSATFFRSSDIPFLLENEVRGKYRTLIWKNYLGADTLLALNQTHPDPGIREIIGDVRFRRALSLAIDRDEINDIFYFGQAVPRQMFVAPMSKFYEADVARNAYVDFDPEEARRLLNEMGLVDSDGDGFRNRPDGSRLNLIVETTGEEETMELVLEQWREVGLNLFLRPSTLMLMRQRGQGNQLQMIAWYGDRVGDTLFPADPRYFVPTVLSGEAATWGLWAVWFQTGGAEGIEPPDEAKELMAWWMEMRSSPDRDRRIELGRKIMRSQAENLWTIGTVGFSPKPVVVSNRLRNVPEQGYWGWDTKLILPYHSETFFLESETP